jgi:mannose-6-phosphate isomerase-like protein (cupin superfamily)
VHDSPQDHVIVMRSGRMRWTVEDQTLDAEPSDVIVTPAGTAHAHEVLGDSRRALSASTRPRVPSCGNQRLRPECVGHFQCGICAGCREAGVRYVKYI